MDKNLIKDIVLATNLYSAFVIFFLSKSVYIVRKKNENSIFKNYIRNLMRLNREWIFFLLATIIGILSVICINYLYDTNFFINKNYAMQRLFVLFQPLVFLTIIIYIFHFRSMNILIELGKEKIGTERNGVNSDN